MVNKDVSNILYSVYNKLEVSPWLQTLKAGENRLYEIHADVNEQMHIIWSKFWRVFNVE